MGFFKEWGKAKGRKLAEEMKNSPENQDLIKQSRILADELAQKLKDDFLKNPVKCSWVYINYLENARTDNPAYKQALENELKDVFRW